MRTVYSTRFFGVEKSSGRNENRPPATHLSGTYIQPCSATGRMQGCVILQPYDMEVGAGTFHTATFLRSIGPEHWSAAYVQPSRRPTDGRYGDNPLQAAALLPVPGADQTLAAAELPGAVPR